jgi:autotransporter-associated beta strand protein
MGGFSDTVNALTGSGTVDGTSGAPVLTLGGNNASGTFAGILKNTAGSLSLNKIGSGAETLGGTNTFTGTTTLTAGILDLTNSLALQNSVVATTGTGSLTFDSSVATHAFTLGGLSGSQPVALADTASNAVALSLGSVNSASYSGSLSGAGSLIKVGAGTQTLGGADAYGGTTTISAGLLEFANLAALYNDSSSSWTTTNITVAASASLGLGVGDHSAGYFDNSDLATLFDAGHLGASSPTVGMKSSSILALDTTNATGGTFTPANPIANVGAALANGLTKLGAGTLLLNLANTYTGPTDVSAGTLQVDVGGAISVSGQILVGGASTPTLAITGGTVSTSFATNPLYVGATAGQPGAVTISSGSFASTSTSATVTIGDNAVGTFTQTGGTVAIAGTSGAWLANNAGGAGSSLNLSGGSFTTGGLDLGIRGNTTLNVSGTAN